MILETDDRASPTRAGQRLRAGSARSERALRVCYLIDDLGTGGTEGQLLSLIRHLDRGLVEPYLVLLRGEGRRSQSLEPDDCPVIRLGIGALSSPKTLGNLLRFARFLRRQQFDLLQIYFRDSALFGVPAGRLAGVPRILCTRVNLARAETPLQRRLIRLCTRLAYGVIANSPMCRDAAVEFDGARPDTVHVIENGVELARYDTIHPLPPNSRWRPRRVGLLANLRPVKDPDTLVLAAQKVVSRHPDAVFFMAGEGELRKSLEQLIRRLGLQDHVFLRGNVKDVPAFLGDIDIGVLCSLSEGAPNAILEYMAAGRAVVATGVGGTRHVVQDGVNGLLVPPADAEALANALIRLLGNPTEAIRLAAAARVYVRQRCDAALRARRCEALYTTLVGQ